MSFFRNALGCRKLVPAEYWYPYGTAIPPPPPPPPPPSCPNLSPVPFLFLVVAYPFDYHFLTLCCSFPFLSLIFLVSNILISFSGFNTCIIISSLLIYQSLTKTALSESERHKGTIAIDSVQQ